MKPKPKVLDWYEVAASGTGMHATKRAILEAMAEAGNVPATPDALSKLIGVTLGSTSYHVRQLLAAGDLVLDRVEPRRGALQHFYTVDARLLLTPRQQARRALSRSTSRLTGEDEFTPESFAMAMATAAFHAGAAKLTWEEYDDEARKRMLRVSGELLRGVAGA